MESIIHILSLAILILLPRGVISSCLLSDLGKNLDDICVGNVMCYRDINNLVNILDDWSCRLSEHWSQDRYGYRRLQTNKDDNYYINLIIRAVDSNEDTFRILSYSQAAHVIKLEAKKLNMINIPSQIVTFVHGTDIDLSNNRIETIDLSIFLELKELRKVNFSHNAISTLAVDSEDSSIRTSGATSIDLSYNLIKSIPNNYFLRFNKLQYIDLSHNFISSFNMITFEGIMKLQILNLSHNKLNSLGHTLTRFVNLIELNLNENLLSSILEPNFVAMSKLQKLNLSSNCIQQIENTAFQTLVDLAELDLGNNQIDKITKELFINNHKLQLLSLSHNNIKLIETEVFKGKNITEFQIDNNKIMNRIESSTFQGIYVNSLDLSKGQIKTLGPEAFSAMNTTIVTLNLSSNLITNMSKTSFHSLHLLTELDLSHNNLNELALDTSDLKNLTLFFVQNNSIEKISRDTFSNLSALTKLDLSFNCINEIELYSFNDLNKLELLILKHNALFNTIDAYTFEGLITLKTMDIMNTNIRSYDNYSLSDAKLLKLLNSSHGHLSFIEYNVFKKSDSLEVLDFSYNLLENFDINTTTIAGVKEIYLHNNNITMIMNATFTGLSSLRILQLSNNNIIRIEPEAFHDLHNLLHLYLLSNPDMEISDTSLNNLTLTDLSLENVKMNFSFQFVTNASVANLELQECAIVNINTVYVFNIGNVEKLNLRSNEIAILDKSSFRHMPNLIWLDLSFNKITYIQPGSFMDTNMVNVLYLNENYIESLQYGVLDGLRNIRDLNLSSNALNSFAANLLHNSPFIDNICLDDNVIQSINFKDFDATGIKSISIGGNLISCDTLVELKKNTIKNLTITTNKLNFNIENVDGITCSAASSKTKKLSHKFSENSTDTIGPALTELSNSIENLRVSINLSNSKTVSNESLAIDGLTSIMKNFRDVIVNLGETITNETNAVNGDFIKALNKCIESLNKSQIPNNIFMEQLVGIHNETRSYIQNLNEFINSKSIGTEESANNSKSQLSQLEELLRRMINEERDALRNNINSSIENVPKSNLEGKELENDKNILSDVKMLLSFMSVCLALILGCVVGYIAYKGFIVRRRLIPNKIHSSSQPIANVMEMELCEDT